MVELSGSHGNSFVSPLSGLKRTTTMRSHIRMTSAFSRARYAPRAAWRLVACPFCREMFEHGEAKECPICGMTLVAFEKLPPSRETHDEFGLPRDPAHELLPWTYFGRMRGALAASRRRPRRCFFSRGFSRRFPRIIEFSGFLLARRHRLGLGCGRRLARARADRLEPPHDRADARRARRRRVS